MILIIFMYRTSIIERDRPQTSVQRMTVAYVCKLFIFEEALLALFLYIGSKRFFLQFSVNYCILLLRDARSCRFQQKLRHAVVMPYFSYTNKTSCALNKILKKPGNTNVQCICVFLYNKDRDMYLIPF